MAPTSAAEMAISGTAWPTMPLPTVFATSVPAIAPAKFSTAAITIATVGGSTRVEITVATALAVSWKPLMKSKMTASEMSTIRRGVSWLSMLDHEATQHVRNVLTLIGHQLHVNAVHDAVASVLQIVELGHHLLDVGEVSAEFAQQLGRLDVVLRGLLEPIEEIAVRLARLELGHAFLLDSRSAAVSASTTASVFSMPSPSTRASSGRSTTSARSRLARRRPSP